MDAIRYRFGRGRGGVQVAGLSVPIAGERMAVRGEGATRALAMADALARVDDLLIGELGLCCEVGAGGADSMVAGLEARYGDKIRAYGSAVRSGIEAGKALSDAGSSPEKILDGIATGMAAAGAILATIPMVGWIAGAVVEIAAAILAGMNALMSAYPARALDPYQGGINLALRALGYSHQTGDPYELDADALMAAAREGWFFDSRQAVEGESGATMVASWPLAVMFRLTPRIAGELDARGYSAQFTRAQSEFRKQLELGRGVETPEVAAARAAYRDVAEGGAARFMAIFGTSDVEYPTPFGTKDGGAFLGHFDGEGGPMVVVGLRLDKLPADMRRAVRASFLAPREEWPEDRGVGYCLRHILPVDSASQTDKDVAVNLLAFMGEWVAREPLGSSGDLATAAPRFAAAPRRPMALPMAQPMAGDRSGVRGPETIYDGAEVEQIVAPTAPPAVAADAARKLDAIRELAELVKSGDARRVERIVRGGGPFGRLARELLKGAAR